MEKEFVPYEFALKLKALGFDKKCITTIDQTNYIHTKGTRRPIRGAMVYNKIDCPTFSQAFRWFRERYSLYSHIRESYAFDNTLGFVSQINGSCVTHGIVDKPINRFDAYEEAELACLTKLIEIVETQTK